MSDTNPESVRMVPRSLEDRTPTGYSSPENAARAKNALSLMQAKLTGLGIESHVAISWYWYSLGIIQSKEHDGDNYKALEVRDSQDSQGKKLLFCFDTIRVTYDGEILYRGPTIEEGLENLDEELMTEVKRQHQWAGTAVQRRADIKQEEEDRRAILRKLHDEFPLYRNGINCYNKIGSGARFAVTIQDLTEDQIRTLLQTYGQKSQETQEADS